ncbi:TetR/AcrR family transcriptional regulator [Bacillus mojavensis]|jgi:TetR/AcrR family transcriptional repressor of lmrAB and yxaGH operons|uniref:TetR/AcrR family transcriptional regulator n=1 Tax=Bacillus mojavensis TaxID=72360 RepID=A0AAP3CNE8_BACMO|nr:TetR/AcrR family transcriptional regulator [Bacillus mojavensis]MCY8104592.1 TetR/AcrR family transcriptional regulator [Bacillus mojavensis]MCY8483608.1 TetR/AcrR family transcriptional regulator [Bacillus mojavensis]MCY8508069.1 TetR/AcrR family transcriptional regulator [Bacillus mojavensis]MCY9093177.1 TetR/AcrR family transcriptional regulator [Bacillus mojavensis]MDR4228879.1 TetR/AcrR family transcriptional regulator [Bacillus mojavensis]
MSYGDAREKILSAATRLFQLQGYYGTGLNQIIKESGAPKGSLYYHFPGGKEQLAIEAVNEMKEYIRQKITDCLDVSPDPAEGIQAFLKELSCQFSCTEDIEGLPVGLLAAETSLKSESLRKACDEAYKAWSLVFEEKLQLSGYSESHAKEAGIVINAMIEGGILLSLTAKDSTPLLHISSRIPALLKK